ncbi:MAG: hypothetical protein RL734_793 [Bacteroidota bacterium]|jgi:hypothetical protein
MKTLFTVLFILFLTLESNAQPILERSFFSMKDTATVFKYETLDLWQLNIRGEGEGFYWDCSNMLFLPVDVKFEITKFKDTIPDFRDNTYLLTAFEGGSNDKAYELYSINDHALLFRGFGVINEDGSKIERPYDKPYSLLRFPLPLGSSYIENHQFRNSTRTYMASGTLVLPGRGTFKAIKIKDNFEDGNSIVNEYSWYIDSIPYPVIRVTDRFQKNDSSLLNTVSEFFLTKATTTDIKDSYVHNAEVSPKLIGNVLTLQPGFSLIGAYSIDGSQIRISQVNDAEYAIESSLPSHICIIMRKEHGDIHRHILPVQK